MRDGELDIEHPRAERGQDLAELSLCPGRPERARARADDGHRLVPEHVRRHRARDPVDRVLQLARDRRVVLRVEKSTASAVAIAWFKRATLAGRGCTSSSSS